MTTAVRKFSLAEHADALFKTKYLKLSENVYNSANVLLGRVKKSYTSTGKHEFIPVPQSFSGGVGSGSLPKANTAKYEDALITFKKVYAVVEVEREAIKAAMNDEGAFVRATRETVKKGVESYMRNMSRILFNDGTGALGEVDVVVDEGSGQYLLTIEDDASALTNTAIEWKDANLEERDIINIGDNTDCFEILEVLPATFQIRVRRVLGSHVPAADEVLYMQGSKDNDPQGLRGVCDATTGSLYNIPVGRRWQATQLDAAGAAISHELINKMMLDIEKKSGKSPNLIITSYKQYEKYLNTIEDQKRYNISPRDKNLKGKISFEGLEVMSSKGPIGIFPERFCEDDRMYFLNDNSIQIHHRPDFGWFDDDGTVFLRKSDEDCYEARYGGYFEVFINPAFQGVLTGLNKA